MALASKRRLIVGSVVLGLAVVLGILYGYLAGVAVLIVAVMGLMLVYMRSHTDVLTSGDTQRAAEDWSRKQFGSDEDSNR
jgi:cell division septal protein FtsQ